ncbi:hypothetical protein ACP275_06G046800 [Erythranthe tilingii]
MNTFSHVPPGFRFHPTDEELVDYYLRRKINSRPIDLDVIKDVDLYKIEPWDLQELCRIGTEEQNEWYFFSHKDKKYPTGTRTNRATTAGFWKATGRDKAIYSKSDLIGMRKTLVFYKGRAPNGQKSDWIMHEYRLETDENGAPQEEGWVVCRVFKKRIATMRRINEHDSPIWYEDQVSFMPDHRIDSPNLSYHHHHNNIPYNNNNNSCKKKEMDLHLYDNNNNGMPPPHHFLDHHHLPHLDESPKMPFYGGLNNLNHPGDQEQIMLMHQTLLDHNHRNIDQSMILSEDQVTDWRVLDKFVASQLSHEEISKGNNTFHVSDEELSNVIGRNLNKGEIAQVNASASSSSCQIELWK